MNYIFGDYTLDDTRYELRRSGESVAIEPKAFKVLAHLIQHRDRVVTKTELLEQFWPGVFVSESALTRCLARVRRAVHDEGPEQRIIKTIRGHGYRFVAALAPRVTEPAHPAVPGTSRLRTVVDGQQTPPLPGPTLPCPQCQTVNKAERLFCAACGHTLARPCPQCGFRNDPGDRFCGGCGHDCATTVALPDSDASRTPLSYTPKYLAEQILTTRSALEGERKYVTVCFADLQGSTALAQGIDPEVLHKVLDGAFALMLAEVHRVEGSVNQFTGDGIMALFGAPLAQEDHVIRALHAALGIQRAFATYAEELRRLRGISVALRIGLHTGLVVVGKIGDDLRMDYTAQGFTTHLADRLQRLAREGSIYVSEAVRQQAEGFFRFNDVGAYTVPGIAQPVRVYECTGVGQVTSRLAAALRRRVSPFVGRERETALLRALWTRVCHGQGQVVCLFGEAGIGKSRLAFEARDTLTGGRLLEAQTLSYGQQTPYHAIVPPVRTLLAVSGDATPHEQRQQLRTRLVAMHPALASDEPLLAHLLGLPVEPDQLSAFSPEEHKRRLQQACLQVLGQQATDSPLCLCIEDLHWLDHSSQEVLDALVTSLARLPILLLGTARPGFRHTWADHTYFHQLTIEPLADEHTDALIRDSFRPYDASMALKALIHERTEGNPFFVEELLHTLQEQELVTLQDEMYVLKAGTHVEIPAAIQGVVAARIDRLPPEAKWCLQAAAVIGREVPFSLLHALADLSDDALSRSLDQLRGAEFLYETRFFPDYAYTFKHALTHEVAYESLLRERRRTLHARIVEIIEALDADRRIDQIERLAYHALRGEVWDKAVTYFRQAGVQAATRSANREAVAGFEQALVALQHLPDTRETRAQAIDLRFDLRNTLLLLGEHEKILNYMREAEALAKTLDDDYRHARVSAYLCTYFVTAGDYDQAIASGEHALAITTALGDFPLHVDLNFRLGQVYHAIGAYQRAMAFLRRNVESLTGELLYARFGHGYLLSVFSRAWLGWCLAEVGEFDEGLTQGEEGIQVAEAVDQPFSLIAAYYSVGSLYLQRGAFHKAIPVLEQNLALCQAANNRLFFPWVASGLGCALAYSGALAAAFPLLEQAVEQVASMRTMLGHVISVARLSEASLLAGRLEDARQLAARALDLAQEHKERGHQAWAHRLLGDSLAHGDPVEVAQAEDHYRQARALAEELGMRPLLAHCHLGLGTLHSQVGRLEQARTELATAMALYRSMAMTFWLPQAEAALVRMA